LLRLARTVAKRLSVSTPIFKSAGTPHRRPALAG
jgi:hypothetical protein